MPVAASLSVLVIDDDDMVRRAIVRGLRRKYDVTELRDAETALVMLCNGCSFDAIFCDLNLKGMSGRDFFLNLEANNEDQAQRVVIMSGNVSAFAAGDWGIDDPILLEKPASMARIDALVQQLASAAARAA